MDQIITALVILIVLMLLGVPIPFSFALSSIYTFFVLGQPSGIITSDGFEVVSSFTIVAVPFYIYAGDLMNIGGIAAKLVDFSNAFSKGIKGALGHATIISNLIFGAISGSSVAAVAAVGSILFPKLVEQGYERKYAAALVSASGFLGILIPPSIPMIIFASVVPGSSIKALFLGGVIPGFILAFFFMLINYFAAKKMLIRPLRGTSTVDQSLPQNTKWRSFFGVMPALFAPVIILGGIYGGVFTPTEAAGVACVYAIVVGFWVYKGLKWNSFLTVTINSVNTIGVILSVLLFVFVLGRILTSYHMPQNLASALLSLSENKFVLLLILDMFLIIMGCFMDAIAGTIVCAPLLLPLATQLGLSTTQYGVIMCVGFGVGLLTPPVAPNLFVGAKVSNLPISDFMIDVLPFLGVSVIVLLLVTYVPAFSTFLPDLLGCK